MIDKDSLPGMGFNPTGEPGHCLLLLVAEQPVNGLELVVLVGAHSSPRLGLSKPLLQPLDEIIQQRQEPSIDDPWCTL